MPNTNTDAEVLQAKNAVALIAKKYQTYLFGNTNLLRLLGMPSSGKLNTVINFMNDVPFKIAQKNPGLRKDRQDGACLVTGFTAFETGAPVIYLNRTLMTPATIIHELLHLLTHAGFYTKFRTQTNVVEGMTEHFTRAVQGKTSASDKEAFRQFCKENSPRKGHYTAWTKNISQIDSLKLKTATGISHVLEQAFFKGDPNALDALAFALDRPDLF
jgi:hypothetical protein